MTDRINASAPTPCRCMVSDLFHSPLGVLFTFPSRYLFTIDHKTYLALAVSSAGFPRAIRVSRYSRMTLKEIFRFHIRGYYRLGPCFPARSVNETFCNSSNNKLFMYHLTTPSYPMECTIASTFHWKARFGLFPFRSPLLRK